ncbi:hypothetical protein [Cellulomonas shaoxiangyii]|uniref:Uncharacterized protein n=1 Tax=Cellulomonas shaoxiangyii TaxID=2566013 RepID=A0A4P7SKN9_9CELL|nr:hypothetical protein [Cellulomonas shaoxiangyii]QCB94318.1 hypothetical protein E5225_12880 [Cellulomonas shaoxiangyii]TGY77813.1 hypothetical protein E5226_16775 [Cellulomonas shaoxiangyii]
MTSPEPASVPRTAPDLGIPSRAWLVAVLTALMAATWSSLVLPGTPGAGPAVAAVVVVVLAGLGTALLLRGPATGVPGVPDARQVLVAAVVAVALAVPALLSTGALAVVLSVPALAAALAALTLAVVHASARLGGGRQAATGLLLGAGLWTALGTTLRRTDATPVADLGADPWTAPFWSGVLLVALGASAVAAAVGLGHADALAEEPPSGRPRRTWVVGPAVLVLGIVLADPTSAAAAAGVGVGVAGLVLVLATSVGVWLLLRPDPWSPAARVVATVAVPAGVVGTYSLSGPPALAAAAVALVAAGAVLASALSAHRPAPPGARRTALATAAVAATALAPWLLSALGQHPVGLVLAVGPGAALALAAAGLRRRTPDPVGAGAAAPVRASSAARIPARVNSARLLLLPALVLALVHAVAGAGEPPPPREYVIAP